MTCCLCVCVMLFVYCLYVNYNDDAAYVSFFSKKVFGGRLCVVMIYCLDVVYRLLIGCLYVVNMLFMIYTAFVC